MTSTTVRALERAMILQYDTFPSSGHSSRTDTTWQQSQVEDVANVVLIIKNLFNNY